MTERDHREEICPDCQATPENRDVRNIKVCKDLETGAMYTKETWHTEDCPQHTVEQIMMEEGVRRAKERDAWMKEAFPLAHERLKAAAAGLEGNEAAAPFVAALIELVGRQGQDLGRFVPPDQWVEILDRHFPPEGDEPTA
jgi:ribosomal protein L37AE/L43A